MSAPVTPQRFDGKVVAITGGGSGIGEAAVQRFTAEGTAAAVSDRDGIATRIREVLG